MPEMEGVVTIVQEGRFQLTDTGGVSHHFVLGSHALCETEQLPALAHEQSRVRVKYAQAKGVIAFVAKRITLLDAGLMTMVDFDVSPRARDYTQSTLKGLIPDKSELTAGCLIEPGKQYGFFTDTTVCIGCKACEVACKEWNNLPADEVGLTGHSYDNTGALSANTWRHVAFVEKKARAREADGYGVRENEQAPFQSGWLMMSDVCKHCHHAPCMEACPTGALFKTEFDTVVVQQDICNGCGYCVPACPFGVVDVSTADGKAHKCTLCYDRLKGGLEPACAKSCPTDSIQFGELGDLHARAKVRVEELHERGVTTAYTYGAPGDPGSTGDMQYLNAFFLLTDRPEAYNLPAAPTRPSNRVRPALSAGLMAVAALALGAVAAFAGAPRHGQ